MVIELCKNKITQQKYYLSCLKKIFLGAFSSWLAHRANSKGAALAFYTLFSLTPILVLMIAVMGYVLGEKAAHGEVIAQISGLVGESGAHVVQNLLVASSSKKSGIIASMIAGLLMFIGATTVLSELKSSLDEIWEVKKIAAKKKKDAFKQLLRTRILSFGIIVSLAMLLLTSMAISTILTIIEPYAREIIGNYFDLFSYLSALLSFCVTACMFAVTYKMLPDILLSWRDVLVGAALTTILFGVGKLIIGIYLKHSAVSSSFGAAGSLVALLLWIYYSSQVFFFGAEVTRQFTLNFGSMRNGRQIRTKSKRSVVNQVKPETASANPQD